jgi:CRISPR-associated protein Cmr3
MSNLKTYKIDLRPMDVFFFGGEQHFGEGEEANYFVRSNYFPQQSGVLGMLRHQLLIQNDCIHITKVNNETVSSLIGKESYNIERNDLHFGAIHEISPLYISNNGELLFSEALEYYIDKKNKPDQLSQIEVEVKDEVGKTLIYPDIKKPSVITAGKKYLGKYEIKELLVSKNGELYNYPFIKEYEKKGTLPGNGLFIQTGKPGIQKSLRKQKGEKDQGFYKQYSYAFPENVCFTFFVQIDRDVAKNFESGRIMMGGEKSPFHMVVEEYNESRSPFREDSGFYNGLYERPHSSLNKIVCLSDCIVDDELAGKLTFMSNIMIDFRNSRSIVAQTSDYNRISAKSKGEETHFYSPTRSNKYQLLKRGTVLWVDNKNLKDVLLLIKKDQHHAIGYNYFKIIQKN